MAGSGGRGALGTLVSIVVAVSAYFGVQHALREDPSDPPDVRPPPEWNVAEPRRDRVGEIMNEELQPLMRHPRFRTMMTNAARGQRSGEAARDTGKRLGMELVHRGIPRLPLEGLDEWNRLRLLLADHSPRVCGAFWTGGLSEGELGQALASLGDTDLRSWMRVSAQAGILELEANAQVQANDRDLARGLETIASRMPREERRRFWAVVDAGETAPAADGCAVMKTIMTGATRMRDRPRERFLRALAAL